MEKIQLYKHKKTSFRFLSITAVFFFLFGIVDFTNALINGFDFEFPEIGIL